MTVKVISVIDEKETIRLFEIDSIRDAIDILDYTHSLIKQDIPSITITKVKREES